MRDARERAIRDWLADTLPDIGGPALVIYEDNNVPRLIRREQLEGVVVVATTRAMLTFAEERGLIPSAEDVWNSIVNRAAGANPQNNVTVVRPRREP
jgi:hypothetical protein